MNLRIQVGTGKGVAERWKAQYCQGGQWGTTCTGPAEEIYNKLVALGKDPGRDAVTAIIGNASWSNVYCNCCSEYVTYAVSFGCDYGVAVCKRCLAAGAAALSACEP